MAIKKLRFPLEMENGTEVRTIEELRENFSMEKVLLYYSDGRLLKWLRNNYLDEEAEAVSELDPKDPDLNRKLCDIFYVEYNESARVDIEEVAANKQRLTRLKEYTSEKQFDDVIDRIAFDQNELEKLLKQGVKEIYLCGDRFNILLDRKGISYIGVNEPTVVIDSDESVDFKAKNIAFQNIKFDEEYLKTVEIEKLNADFSGTAKDWVEPPLKKIISCLELRYSLDEKEQKTINEYLKKGYVHYSMFLIDYKYDKDYVGKEYKTYQDIYNNSYCRRDLVSIIADNLEYIKKTRKVKMSKKDLMSYAKKKAADISRYSDDFEESDKNVFFDLLEYSGLLLFNLDNSNENVIMGFKSKTESYASYHYEMDAEKIIKEFKKANIKRLYTEDIQRVLNYFSGFTNSIKIGVFLPKEIDKKIMSVGIPVYFDDYCGLIIPFDYIKDILSDENVFLIMETKPIQKFYGLLHDFSLYRDTVTNSAWLINGFANLEHDDEDKYMDSDTDEYDEYYKGYCPECGEWIEFDKDMIDEDGCVVCPNCEEEFDIDDFENEA